MEFTPQGDVIKGSFIPPIEKKQRLQAEGNASYDDFLEILVKLGKQVMPEVVITEENPDKDTETPVVTVEIIHETPVPGEIKVRPRSTVPMFRCRNQNGQLQCTEPKCSNFPYWEETCGKGVYPEAPTHFRPEGESVVVWGQRFNTVVQFNCWGKTTPEAGKLTTRFKRFMFTYTGVFRQMGVADVIFSERLRDLTVEKWREDIHCRSLRYRMVFEELYVQEYTVIGSIVAQLSADMRQPVDEIVTLFRGRTSIT